MSGCNCIQEIEAGLDEHKLDVAIVWDRAANTLVSRTYSDLKRKDNGRSETRSKKPRMFAHTFCPFCGDRYDDQVPA